MRTVRTYSLEWLDSLVSVTLNPSKPYLAKLQEKEALILSSKVPEECQQAKNELVDKIFAINKESQVRHLVQKYHASIKSLLNEVSGYKSSPDFAALQPEALHGILMVCLGELSQFIEGRFGHYINPATIPLSNDMNNNPPPGQATRVSNLKHKIVCNLSGDQIALILRGADEAQVVKARSMNAVFTAVIPYLSTEHKEALSANAIRSKAYNPEEADRDTAVAALEAIIRKIKTY